MGQDEVLQMFLNRSPLLEEVNSQPKEGQAPVSQEYQLMAMNINKAPEKGQSIENSLESPFKVPLVPAHARVARAEEEEAGGDKALRKRDLKALDRQHQALMH
jgi:hypothetical protein